MGDARTQRDSAHPAPLAGRAAPQQHKTYLGAVRLLGISGEEGVCVCVCMCGKREKRRYGWGHVSDDVVTTLTAATTLTCVQCGTVVYVRFFGEGSSYNGVTCSAQCLNGRFAGAIALLIWHVLTGTAIALIVIAWRSPYPPNAKPLWRRSLRRRTRSATSASQI